MFLRGWNKRKKRRKRKEGNGRREEPLVGRHIFSSVSEKGLEIAAIQ